MSIQIKKEHCSGCGRCIEVCPGNLIKKELDGKASIRHERDCWGCTSCLKACKFGAIEFFLGADIGGNGGTLSVQEQDDSRIWTVTKPDGSIKQIQVFQKDANKY